MQNTIVASHTKTACGAKPPAKTVHVSYRARNPKQQLYIHHLENDTKNIVVAYGAAGSAKTALGVTVGLGKVLGGDVKRLVITRPSITVDSEQFGYLPGTLNDKFMPFLMPVIDALEHSSFTKENILQMIQHNTIEIAPIAFCRGRTFTNCWIVCDESQNMTRSQLLTMLTRIGKGSKMVLTGDPAQHDRVDSGFMEFVNLVKANQADYPEIALVQFEEEDIERHNIVRKVIQLYSGF
jgi:phosphate starvation-inducible PhoH-like protein